MVKGIQHDYHPPDQEIKILRVHKKINKVTRRDPSPLGTSQIQEPAIFNHETFTVKKLIKIKNLL